MTRQVKAFLYEPFQCDVWQVWTAYGPDLSNVRRLGLGAAPTKLDDQTSFLTKTCETTTGTLAAPSYSVHVYSFISRLMSIVSSGLWRGFKTYFRYIAASGG